MNSSRNLFGSSPCTSAVNGFGWYNHGAAAVKSTSTDSASDGGGSEVLQAVQNPHQPILQVTHDWIIQDLLNDSGRSEENYSHLLNTFKQGNQSFPLEQHQPNSLPNLPLNSDSYSYTSSLFDADSQHHQSLLHNQAMNYSSPPNYQMHSNMVKPSLPKHQFVNNFQFVNNTPFGNASAAADSSDIRASFLSSTQPQLIPSAFSKAKLNPYTKHHNKKAEDADSMTKKGASEPALKRARIETPPMPTFKVRKEKLGDRVTALQQLVSPFGKTDTASVLHEAIEYIKLLHDQVTVLSTPYLKNGSPPLQRQQDEEEPIKDLRSRGLCLVPISSTLPVAAETSSDFWSPTFGGSFR